MGAPIGNQYWRLRRDMSEDGRKLSVDDLIERLNNYITRCREEKLNQTDWVGKDAIQVERPHMLAMSIWGACAWIGITFETWKQWKKDEKYSEILTHAETIFKGYNIEGSAAGMLNQGIIARLEGLNENLDVTSAGEKISTTVIVQDQSTKENMDKLFEKEKK